MGNDVEVMLWSEMAPKLRAHHEEYTIMLPGLDVGGYLNPMAEKVLTPLQKKLCDRLEKSPFNPPVTVFPPLNSEETEEARIRRARETYKEFTLELHTGMHLTHLSSDFASSSMHCQLAADLHTLKIDCLGDGNIIEFPFMAVSGLRRLRAHHKKWYNALDFEPESEPELEPTQPHDGGHVVLVEFGRHKLPFAFQDVAEANRFRACLELLIERAKQTDQISASGTREASRQRSQSLVGSTTPRPQYCCTRGRCNSLPDVQTG